MALCTTPPCVFFHRERNLLPIVGIPLWFRHSGKSSSFQNRAIALLSKFNSKLSAANQLQRCLDSPTGILPVSENLQRWAYSWQATNHASVKAAHCSGVSGFWRTAGEEIGFDAGGCGVNPRPNQLQFKRGM